MSHITADSPISRPAFGHAWRQKIGIRSSTAAESILALSGGNRQKALVARAFATDSKIILFDDPTRGVDIGTKRELYDQIRSAAGSGPVPGEPGTLPADGAL